MTSRRAATVCILIVILLTASSVCRGDSSLDAKRDAALVRAQACLRSDVRSRKCKDVQKDIQTLIDIYDQGDKTVLPTLLRFGYLGDFFREAFVADPNGFLTTVWQLPEPDQRRAASSIDETRSALSRPQFDEIRAALAAIPPSSPIYNLARRCLRTVEMNHASFLVNFFPPDTFPGRAGDYKVQWFSGALYALDEKPLWSPPAEGGPIYRLAVLPAFSAPESVMVTASPDGSGQVRFRVTDIYREGLKTDKTRAITPKQVAALDASLKQAQFWEMSTEPPPSHVHGVDGAEWILEGVEDGKYHIVDRWCPKKTSFGELGRDFFDLAGAQSAGVC